MMNETTKALVEALESAEAALSDIGDADREPGDDVAWCEARAAQAIPAARAALALARAEQAESQGGWQPIETAPRDGTVVLLWGKWAGEINGLSKTDGLDIGYWSDGKSDYPGSDWWSLSTGDAYSCWMKATHWMPLPPSPAV